MKKNLIKIALFGLVAVFSATFVGCKDYDDDIKNLQSQIDSVKDAVTALQEKVGSGKYVESATPFTDGNGGYDIAFSDGTSIKINNGAKGDQGEKGDKGDPGSLNNSKYVVSVDFKAEEAFYVITFTYANGDEPTVIEIPAATKAVTGIKFIPSLLSPGEAARIHFPVIVTDSVTLASGRDTIAGNNYAGANADLVNFDIVYSGKGEFTYQVNPHSASFDAFDEIALVREKAEIWDYSTNDGKWMMFNPGQAWYTNGKLTKAEAYADGNGILKFRAKDWTFAERTDLQDRNVYSLAIQNGDNIIHSDFIPAKHETILQKNVHIVRKDANGTAVNPNISKYIQYYGDDFYRNSINPEDRGQFLSNEATVEAYAENKYYRALAPQYDILYTGASLDLSKDVMAYFTNDLRKGGAGYEYLLAENGFDDFKLVFETVNYYNEGVNQSKRYLNVTEAGVATVTLNSQWAKPGVDESHTAAIGRTPIVRVSLVAPGEDNFNVVKTAIIKLLIVEKSTEPTDVNFSETVTLKHVDQILKVDMDQIFVAAGLSKERFRTAYTWVPYTVAANEPEATEQNAVSIKDIYNNGLGSEFNQLQVTVKNTAFHTDHVVYVAKGTFQPISNTDPVINVNYEVKVKYPSVVAPEPSNLNWLPGKKGNGGTITSSGRENTSGVVSDAYQMALLLDDAFILNNYDPYKGQTTDANTANAVLSFELVDDLNEASNTGVTSGVSLHMTPAGKWELALQETDLGRAFINQSVNDIRKTIKVRAVVSFNECVDGLYGSCTAGTDNVYKYAKKDAQDLPACTLPGHNDLPLYGAQAPEKGRSTTVIETFEVAFINPVVFYPYEIPVLYDKYPVRENDRYLNKSFFLADYLWKDGGQAVFKNAHVIYDLKNVSTNGNLNAQGWNTNFKSAFGVVDPVTFSLGTAYSVEADGTKALLDDENRAKIIIDVDPVEGPFVTYYNEGIDIPEDNSIEFNIDVKVYHRWGLNTPGGYSVGSIPMKVVWSGYVEP